MKPTIPKLEQQTMFHHSEAAGANPRTHPLDVWQEREELAFREHIAALRRCMRQRRRVQVKRLRIDHEISGALVELRTIRGAVAEVEFRGQQFRVGVSDLIAG